MFDIVLADPPWDYYGDPNKNAAAGKHYELMSDDNMIDFDINQYLGPRSILFLWATSPRLDFAIQCIQSWNLHFRGISFVWVKTRKDGNVIGAQGVRPSIVKPTTEFVLAASRVYRGRPIPLASEAVAQVVLAPRQEHSRKPEEVAERIEQLYPSSSKIELFARRYREGWTCVGDEL